ncbi:hypothetical protein WBG78_21005 [Chryseolinea sp. T2]|uniref:hypothetical protein n=1 Tax=Chryseolinea sp. T2 TaxID=3129255 RepID=UPI00307794AB
MKSLLFIISIVVVVLKCPAQEREDRYDFPIVVTVSFPALALPFRNLDLNFRNIGIGLGTEISLNSQGTWIQQLQLAWMRNRQVGNQLMAYTQLAWRPDIGENGFGEAKLGAAYVYGFTPASSYRSENGNWVATGHRGKGMFALPVGVAFGAHSYSGDFRYSPFLGYQFMIITHYNTTVQMIPQTMIQTGVMIAK